MPNAPKEVFPSKPLLDRMAKPPQHTSFCPSHYILLPTTPLSDITVSASIFPRHSADTIQRSHLYCNDPTFIRLLPYPAFTSIHRRRDQDLIMDSQTRLS
ncbi:hypothetical protein EVAR_55730_1 [Eumeta japonica]|uniref:Uncharacterized protein n=1 Tax=Eumeta variegata TaxID=151549 RepID=A0A4C1Z2H6_EUMVA|nr:hypothetical protein EVAR_55730_1 [Eumeta japonica]